MIEKSEIKLPQPKLLDFTKLKKSDTVKIIIENCLHKFSPNAESSGKDIRHQPIFGSSVYINNILYSKSNYGLPFIKFEKNSEPKINWINETLYTFNIHYHGLNTVGSIDGTSMELVFGKSTLLGSDVTFQFPKITNNQSLLWYHNHSMFISMEFIYSGALGLLQISDNETKYLDEKFIYGNNHLMMFASDIDITNNSVQTNLNLPTDQNRSAFTAINGINAIDWYSNKSNSNSNSNPYVNMLYHETTDNLVKIDILNATLNWRVYHIGICDEDYCIKSFYLIQCDNGLMNPQKLKMTYIPVAGRISILIDLKKFKNKIAYLFVYDYDLTEIFNSVQAFPNALNNSTLIGTIPNFEYPSQSPYPTPIPDKNEQNQQDNPTNLNYPYLKKIKQINKILQNGTIVKPKSYNIKPFLKIIHKCNLQEKITNLFNNFELSNSLEHMIMKIRKTVFGEENYKKYYKIISKPFFEYDGVINYIELLNKNYYGNIPKINSSVPIRNFLLFPETNTNALSSGNNNGVSEYIDSANRIMVDLWNSDQLDLNYAMDQYNLNPNNFKPNVLPTSKFKIYKTNDKYSNTAMISNDTITIEFFLNPIAYGDKTTVPFESIRIIFPPTDFLNLQEWIDLVNNTFANTSLDANVFDSDEYNNLSDILYCDWSFFPYTYPYMYAKNICIKSAIIKTQNKSPYYIRILGRWTILQFFGKSMTGSTIDLDSVNENENENVNQNKNISGIPNGLKIIKNNSQYVKCDEFGAYGIYDVDIQAFFPFYATNDGQTQLPIACMKRNGELIINQTNTFKGFYDGYLNDNLSSFSVKLKSTELWLYNNGDNADNHPIHFHLTSGFAVPSLTLNSPDLLTCKRKSNPLIYSRDIYQVGPQETIGFYLTWNNYPSNQKTSTPDISGVGGVIHCHFLPHNDSNSMIIKYYIDPC